MKLILPINLVQFSKIEEKTLVLAWVLKQSEGIPGKYLESRMWDVLRFSFLSTPFARKTGCLVEFFLNFLLQVMLDCMSFLVEVAEKWYLYNVILTNKGNFHCRRPFILGRRRKMIVTRRRPEIALASRPFELSIFNTTHSQDSYHQGRGGWSSALDDELSAASSARPPSFRVFCNMW